MTEAEWTGKIVAFLRNNGCVVFKHCDRFTPAIPDVSVTALGYTTWLEMKYLKHGEDFFKFVMKKKDQFMTMTCLDAAGRAYYLLQKEGKMYVFKPREFIAKQSQATAYAVTSSSDLSMILCIVRNEDFL